MTKRHIAVHVRRNALELYVAAVVTFIALSQLCLTNHLHDWVFGR